MKEQDYDTLLNIKTVGDQQGFNKSIHYHRYEPTPYKALEQLFHHYELDCSDRVVDFGCGKGRLNFYIHHLYHVTVVGVEMNEAYYQAAMENKASYLKKVKNSKDKIHFFCCLAEDYEINPLDNRFYFFNPFSVQIFMNIINNILLSVEKSAREVELVIYYGSEEYQDFLENQTSFEWKKEVKLEGYEHNPRERFLVYRLAY